MYSISEDYWPGVLNVDESKGRTRSIFSGGRKYCINAEHMAGAHIASTFCSYHQVKAKQSLWPSIAVYLLKWKAPCVRRRLASAVAKL